MPRTKTISRKLFIEELERPAQADAEMTTLAVGEESMKGGGCKKLPPGTATTMAVGEECMKG